MSADGKQVACASQYEGTVRVFDAHTGEAITRVSGDREGITSLSFSSQGHLIAGSKSGTAMLWDPSLAAGKRIRGHTSEVKDAKFSLDCAFAVTASKDKTAVVWNVLTRKQVCRLAGHTESVIACALSRDGRLAVTGGWDALIFLWSVPEGKHLRTWQAHQSNVQYLFWTYPNGEGGDGSVFSCSQDRSMQRWGVEETKFTSSERYEGKSGRNEVRGEAVGSTLEGSDGDGDAHSASSSPAGKGKARRVGKGGKRRRRRRQASSSSGSEDDG
uniref:Guanine nucleotide-binding protein subunit beta-like protein n=1 Tax=Palpitomonas bilix TaxID=652834 RepID=A0A7S3FZI9_9EUKA